jgi:hypothetical protein
MARSVRVTIWSIELSPVCDQRISAKSMASVCGNLCSRPQPPWTGSAGVHDRARDVIDDVEAQPAAAARARCRRAARALDFGDARLDRLTVLLVEVRDELEPREHLVALEVRVGARSSASSSSHAKVGQPPLL